MFIFITKFELIQFETTYDVKTFAFKRFKNKVLLFNHIFLRVWLFNNELLLYLYKRFS